MLSGACVIETVPRPWCVGVGHPRPHRLPGPSVPWVSLPGPTGVPSDAQAGWHREQSANPCGCVAVREVKDEENGEIKVEGEPHTS